MKKILSLFIVSVLILTLAGCGTKEPAANEEKVETTSETNQRQTTDDPQKPNETASGSKTLPSSYPKEVLPLAADAEILDVRENPANNGLEVSYVSDNNIGTLCDFYEGALKDAKDFNTDETPDGYWITAKMDGIGYTIMLSKDAMKSNPQYAGKISVYIVLTKLEEKVTIRGDNGEKVTFGDSKWPTSELARNIPEFKHGTVNGVLESADSIVITLESVKEEDVSLYWETIKKDFLNNIYEMIATDFITISRSNDAGINISLVYMSEVLTITVTVPQQ